MREHLFPAYVQRYKTKQLTQTLSTEYQALGNPYETLGMRAKDSGIPPSKCYLERAAKWGTNIDCHSFIQANDTTMTPEQTAAFPQLSREIQSKLDQHNWYPQNADRKLTDINPTLQGEQNRIAVYAKDTGDIHCQIEFMFDPLQNNLDGRYFCSQNFKILGDPYYLE